jgi:hypothetical protein
MTRIVGNARARRTRVFERELMSVNDGVGNARIGRGLD